MGGAIGISRVDLTAVELRAAAGREKNGATSKNDSKASYLRRQRMALDLALKRSKMLFAGIMG